MNIPISMRGKWALVTGASSGIGKEIALQLANLGMHVIITARRASLLDAVHDEIVKCGVSSERIVLDLLSEGSAQQLFDEVQTRGIVPHVVVNNAGCGVFGLMHDQDPVAVENMLRLNVEVLTGISQRFAKIMPKGSFMMLVASVVAFGPTPYYAAYAASKSYVHRFGYAMYHEYKGRIHVCTLYPGMTDTEFFEVSHQYLSPVLKASMMMSPAVVARQGIGGMFSYKTRVIAGFRNRMMSLFNRILPDCISVRIAAYIMRSRQR